MTRRRLSPAIAAGLVALAFAAGTVVALVTSAHPDDPRAEQPPAGGARAQPAATKPVGTDGAAEARRIAGVAHAIDKSRRRGRRRLAAARAARTQAAAADGLARAFRAAARRLDAGAPAATRLGSALERTAVAYVALAAAARARDASRFATARRAVVRREARLARVLAAAQRTG